MTEDLISEKQLKYLNASTRKLIWWKYQKHTLAMIGLISIAGMYFTAIFCEFLAPYNKDTRHLEAIFAPITGIHFFDDQGRLSRPFVRQSILELDMEKHRAVVVEVPGTHFL